MYLRHGELLTFANAFGLGRITATVTRCVRIILALGGVPFLLADYRLFVVGCSACLVGRIHVSRCLTLVQTR